MTGGLERFATSRRFDEEEPFWYVIGLRDAPGEVSEWLKEHAWKACVRCKAYRGFESRPLRSFPEALSIPPFLLGGQEGKWNMKDQETLRALSVVNTMRKNKIETIDDYIASCPEAVRPKLEKLRRAIRSAAPQAEEAISYRMPAFKWNGPLVYFAAFKTHIGFFPTSSPIPVFKKELSAFKTSKGTIRFPLDRPIPFDLVKKIVRFKLKENSARGIKAAP
jgi:uncharacterized protein YdhG (YjbR/CyaY superfamily)